MSQHLTPAVISSKLDLLENKLPAPELLQMLYCLSVEIGQDKKSCRSMDFFSNKVGNITFQHALNLPQDLSDSLFTNVSCSGSPW